MWKEASMDLPRCKRERLGVSRFRSVIESAECCPEASRNTVASYKSSQAHADLVVCVCSGLSV